MTRIAVGGPAAAGLRWPNYVNGRILTASDLAAGQDAARARDRWLGIAIGHGVADGLEVTGSPGSSVLHVSPGTGVAPGGTAVHLDTPASLDLAAVASHAAADGALFADCRSASTTTRAPSAGAYLLTMRPVSAYKGKVPVQGTPASALPTPCASRWEVEEVVFQALPLDGFTATTTSENRRNLLAHWCYGSDRLAPLARSGFTAPVPWRGIDGLPDLDDCDVPLAVFDWDGAALTFVDRWSARRRPVRPSAATGLAAVVGDDRGADGEARFLQFQEQLDELVATAAGRSIRALDVFPLLPPAGLVPISPLAAAGAVAKLLPKATVTAVAELSTDTGMTVMARASEHDKREAADAIWRLGRSARDATGGTSTFGAVSQLLRGMQQDIESLRAEIDDLTAALGARDQNGTSAARAEAARMASTVMGLLADTAGQGVDPARFFAGMQVRVGVVDLETVDFTIRRSWFDEPIDLDADTPYVYFVSTGERELAPYVLFAKRQRGVRWIERRPVALDA